jgi:hypothetical protein
MLVIVALPNTTMLRTSSGRVAATNAATRGLQNKKSAVLQKKVTAKTQTKYIHLQADRGCAMEA